MTLSLILALIAFILFVIAAFDNRHPYVPIAGALLSIAVMTLGGDIAIDTD